MSLPLEIFLNNLESCLNLEATSAMSLFLPWIGPMRNGADFLICCRRARARRRKPATRDRAENFRLHVTVEELSHNDPAVTNLRSSMRHSSVSHSHMTPASSSSLMKSLLSLKASIMDCGKGTRQTM